jgi:hypothetical protein
VIADLFKPQNRYKPKAKPARKAWRLPQIDWKLHARRVAVIGILVGSLVGLSLILDRPIRVMSIDGSFQRVSPGQVEQGTGQEEQQHVQQGGEIGLQVQIEQFRCRTHGPV